MACSCLSFRTRELGLSGIYMTRVEIVSWCAVGGVVSCELCWDIPRMKAYKTIWNASWWAYQMLSYGNGEGNTNGKFLCSWVRVKEVVTKVKQVRDHDVAGKESIFDHDQLSTTMRSRAFRLPS